MLATRHKHIIAAFRGSPDRDSARPVGVGLMVPLDWLRALVPGTAPFTHFYATFERSPYRAALHLSLLVGLIELMRLTCFLVLHQERLERITSKSVFPAQILAAWPEDLIITLSRGGASAQAHAGGSPFAVAPEMRLNQPLPYDAAAGGRVSQSVNLLLSYLMRSAVVLEFLPERPVVLFAREHDVAGAVRSAAKRYHEQSLFAVLAERSTFVTYALPAGASADAASTGTSSRVTLASATPAFGHHLIEAASSPLRTSAR